MPKSSRQSAKTTLDKVLARGLQDILDKVSEAHGVSREEICGRRRTGPIARARHELWWHMRNLPMTYDEIGSVFGRLHSTVVRGIVAYRHAGLKPEVPLRAQLARSTRSSVPATATTSKTSVVNLEARLQRLAAEFAADIAAALRDVPIEALAAVATPDRRKPAARRRKSSRLT